ncbi:MAG: DUF58 domain-containing protein [Acidimicrobiia bacterium]
MLTKNGWATTVLCAVCLATGLLADLRELVALGAALLVALVVAAAWLFIRPSLEVRRDVVPARVAEGEGAAGVLTITNRGTRRSPPLLAHEHLGGRRLRLQLRGLSSQATQRVHYDLPTDRRGIVPVGPLEISHADALGLVGVGYGEGAETRLIVHPRQARVAPLPTGRSQDFDGPTRSVAPRGGIAFHSLRDYVPGDDLRLVHWPTTARTGQLMVKHTVVTNEPRLVIVLDTQAGSYIDERAFDEAVRVTASLVSAGAMQRFPTTLHTTGGVVVGIDATGSGLTEALDVLAAIAAEVADPGLRTLTRLAGRRQHGASLGVVTGSVCTQLSVVSSVRQRYEMATLVQLGPNYGRTVAGVEGVLGIACVDLAEFARVWKARVG